MDTGDAQRELRELRGAVERLERRIARLEDRGGATAPLDAAPAATAPVDAEEHSYAAHFTALAVVSFALVGALILRVATQHGWLAPAVGTALGLAYCTALLAAPWLLGRVAAVAVNAGVLQYCGAGLVPLIVLESFHKTRTLDAATAALILATAAAAGAAAATRADRRFLGMAALALPACAIAAMGFDPDAALIRGGALALCAVLVLRAAHRRGWRFVRPVVLAPVMLSLGLAVIMTARREGIDAATAAGLLGCAVAVWALVLASHFVRAKAMDALEAAWLPVATAWALGLALYASPLPAAAAGSVCAAALLYAATRGAATPPPIWTLAAATAGTIAALLSMPAIDPTRILLVAAALLIQHAAGRSGSAYLGALALIAGVAGAALVTVAPAGPPWTLCAGAVTGTLLIVQYRAAAVAPASLGTVRSLAPALLAAGFVVLFGALRGAALLVTGPGQAGHLAQTLLLGGLALLALRLGRAKGHRALASIGFFGVALFAARVVFWDMFALDGSYALVSVVALGAASVVTSLSLRRRAAPPKDPSPAAP